MTTIDHKAFFIDGAWRAASGTDHFDVISPRSEQRIGSVPAATKEDIDAAVAAARRAFDEGEWPRLTPAERAGYLSRLADGIERRQTELAELITEELGCTLFLSQVYQAVSPVMSFNYSAEIGRSLQTAEVRISDLSSLAGKSAGGSIIPMAGASLVVKEPVGVVASFPAYNFALPAIGQKAGPAMVAGCTVIVKVTEPNPLAIFVIGEICEEIGLPPGVLNIVAARAPESEYLVRHPGVDMVSFTGSAEVGAKIAAACGELVRPCVLELGGKSAAIVLEDAKLEDVLPTLVGATAGTNAGQSCVALSRLLVPESQYRAYAEALADGFASLKVGDPMEADTVVGPLVTSRQRERVEYYVDVARKEGATIAYGGRRPAHLERGWYYEPTLVTDAHNDMRVSREEIFGPVASLIPHRGEDDAVRIANDSDLGLAGSVFTADTAHGFEVARRVRTGTFSVNTFAADLGSPFGGFKKSGIGREHGPYAVEEYLQTKTISIDPGQELPESVTRNVPHGTGPGTRGSAG
ncbi:aldehyde dehydrogenase [Streptomyces sp. NBC_01373]|uniref:aldehyde dehydrogenase n=1 Tax=Streptomyces sp. NBC_01373 TaxID=2903843 RepID=UPI00224F9F63|nr:aldehyde dehydrogenase [Streptomyces sp. NBC_01373]MCX4706538.1 aldehyde dehydrogenase [Streptomyces sp. NBC_01373]